MDQREKQPELTELIQLAVESNLAGMMTCLVGSVTAVHPEAMTVDVQPSLNAKVQQPDGTWVDTVQPIIQGCPIIFIGGGGFSILPPIAAGDECLVIFSHRSIDEWHQAGGIQNRADRRTFHPSDGFALIGPRNLTRILTYDQGSLVVRANDGSAFLSITEKAAKLFATDSISLESTAVAVTAPTVTLSQDLYVGRGLAVTGALSIGGELDMPNAIPTPSTTPATFSIPINIGGTFFYLKLSATP